jgi:hypothetical protein
VRPHRIKTGFHRIGLVAAALCLLITLMYVGVGIAHWEQKDKFFYEALLLSGQWTVSALAAYVVAWAIGWIIAGFAGDNDNI